MAGYGCPHLCGSAGGKHEAAAADAELMKLAQSTINIESAGAKILAKGRGVLRMGPLGVQKPAVKSFAP
jgi:hypothetical protein